MIRKISAGILTGISCLLAMALPAMAAEAAPAAGETAAIVKFALALGAGFGLAIAAFGGALGQARAVAAAMEGIARNPGARAQMFVPLLIGLAFIETLVLYMFVVSFLLLGKV